MSFMWALLFATIFVAANGSLIINSWPPQVNSTTNVFKSAVVKYDGNSRTFEPVNGTLVMYEFCPQCDFRDKIIGIKFRARIQPYIEEVLIYFKTVYNPRAVVFFGEDIEEDTTFDLGTIGINTDGIPTPSVDFPVINVGWKTFYVISAAINATSNLELPFVTVTDEDYNPYNEILKWFVPLMIVTQGIWGLINIGLCIHGLIITNKARNTGTIVLCLHLLANIIRIVHLVDPFRGWLYPLSVTTVLFSMSVPLTLCACALIVLYWYDLLTDSSLTVIVFVSKSKWIAAAIVFILLTVEIVTSSFRAVYTDKLATMVSGVIYGISGIALFIMYIYCTVAVLKKLKQFSRMTKAYKLVRRTTIKICISGGGLAVLILMSILFATPIGQFSLGDCLLRLFTFSALNFVATSQIRVFEHPKNSQSSKGGSTRGTHYTASAYGPHTSGSSTSGV